MKSVCSYAQNTELKNFTFYSQKEGLSNYNIHKIIQDDKKFLWIATQDGLNRFDGTSFTEYNKGFPSRRALLSNDIRDLLYDTAHEMIWVVCNQGGINGIDVLTGNVVCSVIYHNSALDADWRTCAVMLNRYIFIGSSGGVEAFDLSTRTWSKRHTLEASFPLGCSSVNIHAIAADRYQNIWIATEDKGIIIYHTASDSILQILHPEDLQGKNTSHSFWPLCLAFNTGNVCWIGAVNKMVAVQFDAAYRIHPFIQHTKSVLPIAAQTINHLSVSHTGDVLICGNELYGYNSSQDKLCKIQPADQENNKWLTDITCCYEDLQNNLWLGCKQGLGQMKNNRLTFFPVHNGKAFNDALSHVYSVCALDSMRLLAGTKEGLFLVDDQQQKSQQLLTGLVQNIFRLKDGGIIISGDKGVHLWRNNRILPIGKAYSEFAAYPNVQFNSCARLNDSVIILGTESNDGILVWNRRKHRIVNIRQTGKDGLFSNIVNTVFVSNDKHIFVLSDYGITLINGNNFSLQKLAWKNPVSKVPLGIFMDMTETADHYWINTYSEGLVMMDKSFRIVKTYGIKEGITNTGLYKIFNYRDSLLMLTSNYGITAFNVKNKISHGFYEEDGLQNNTFEEACGDTLGNTFYAGGVGGFVKMVPSNLSTDDAVPDLYYTRIKIQQDNQQVTDTSNLDFQSFRIQPGALQTNVTFCGINYNNPKHIRYAYRIRGKGEEWIQLGTQNFITLIGLPAGTYTLNIKARNEDGIWSEPKSLQLTYLPQWYETIWFDMGAGICVAFVLYGFYRYRINQVKEKQLIRKNIASDLHDDLGSTLNTVKVFSHLAKKENNNQTYLNQIELSVTEAIAGLRDMIWVLDDNQDTLQAVADRIQKMMSPLMEANHINFQCRTHLPEKEEQLTKTEKRNLLLMIKETINNSIKYAACSQIIILFSKENGTCQIEVSDNGEGFDESAVSGGNGLHNLRHRARQIHYTASIISSPGNGTTVRIENRKS